MKWKVRITARMLGVDAQQVKKWSWAYKDLLTADANPGTGKSRTFSDSDVLALMYVCERSELTEPEDEIRTGLEREEHFENEAYRHLLYASSPILQEPPDDLDETWRHGILLVGGGVDGYLALARNYSQCARAMLQSALQSGDPRVWGFPVLFAYRHAPTHLNCT